MIIQLLTNKVWHLEYKLVIRLKFLVISPGEVGESFTIDGGTFCLADFSTCWSLYLLHLLQ